MQTRRVAADHGWKWFTAGWKLFSRSPALWIAILVVLLLVNLVLHMIPLIGAVAATLLVPALTGGVLYAAGELDAGRNLRITHLFQAFQDRTRTGPLLTLGVIYLGFSLALFSIMFLLLGEEISHAIMTGDSMAVAGIVGPEIFISLLLLTGIALLIMFAFAYAIPLLILARQPPTPFQAIRLSFSACLVNSIPLFLFSLLWLPAFLIALLPFGLGLLILVPVTFAAWYDSYRDIFGIAEEAPDVETGQFVP